MTGNKLVAVIAGLSGALMPVVARACATCGLSQNPRMLLIGSGFVVLPFSFVGFIAWRLWKDSQMAAQRRNDKPSA